MKKAFSRIFFFLIIFSTFVAKVNAQVSYKIPNPSKYDSLEELISGVATFIRPIFLLTFGGLILWGAWSIETSKGNDEKVMNARKMLIAAIVGFAIAVLAPTIANFFTNFLGVEGFDF